MVEVVVIVVFCSKKVGPKTFFVKKNLGSNKILVQKVYVEKIFGAKKVKNFWGAKKLLVQKIFGSKEVFCNKNVWPQK